MAIIHCTASVTTESPIRSWRPLCCRRRFRQQTSLGSSTSTAQGKSLWASCELRARNAAGVLLSWSAAGPLQGLRCHAHLPTLQVLELQHAVRAGCFAPRALREMPACHPAHWLQCAHSSEAACRGGVTHSPPPRPVTVLIQGYNHRVEEGKFHFSFRRKSPVRFELGAAAARCLP